MINDKQKEGKGILSFNWFKSKSGNDLSNCAVYLLFKECFENEEIEGHQFAPLDMNKKNILDKREQAMLFEKGDKEIKGVFENPRFKSCYTENRKLKPDVEHFMFSFKSIIE